LATGTHPFFMNARDIREVQNNIVNTKHQSIKDYNHSFPAGLSKIIDRLLAKEPYKRYRTTNLLLEELKKAEGEYYDNIYTA